MNKPLVSVIVPVYNTEKYLSTCINSILNQTIDNYEIILVDDGSIDLSSEICEEYSKANDNIKYCRQKNQGVSSARNKGLNNAIGEWVTFIDSDDYVEPDYLENLIKLTDNHCDFIQSGIIFFNSNSDNIIGNERLEEGVYLLHNNPDNCFKIATMPLITSPVSKLYRRSILNNHHIRFNRMLSYGEDRDFNLNYLQYSQCVKTSVYLGYHYRKGLADNLSNNKDFLNLLECDLTYWRNLKTYFSTCQCESKGKESYLANRLFNFIHDRLIQYLRNSKPSHQAAKESITYFRSKDEYSWLLRNFKYVNCSNITKLFYRIKSSDLFLRYLSLLSQR